MKDLIDLALLTLELEGDPGAPARILAEVEKVFDRADTHEPQELLPPPPRDWEVPFKVMAEETGLDPPDLGVWYERVFVFYKEIKEEIKANFWLRIPTGSFPLLAVLTSAAHGYTSHDEG